MISYKLAIYIILIIEILILLMYLAKFTYVIFKKISISKPIREAKRKDKLTKKLSKLQKEVKKDETIQSKK